MCDGVTLLTLAWLGRFILAANLPVGDGVLLGSGKFIKGKDIGSL